SYAADLRYAHPKVFGERSTTGKETSNPLEFFSFGDAESSLNFDQIKATSRPQRYPDRLPRKLSPPNLDYPLMAHAYPSKTLTHPSTLSPVSRCHIAYPVGSSLGWISRG